MARANLIGDNAGSWNAVLDEAWDELGNQILSSPDCKRILDRVRQIRAYNGRQGGNSVRRREVKVLIAVRDGIPIEKATSLEIDHKTAVADGGRDEWKNLRLVAESAH